MVFWLFLFTFFIFFASAGLYMASRVLLWWFLILFLIPPWGWYSYRYVYVPRRREYEYTEIESEQLKRVRFDLEKNTIQVLT